jgi:hypothetical protein
VLPAAADADCNGVDDNCDGNLDEGFVSTPCAPGFIFVCLSVFPGGGIECH